jgi:hypothetical protein
MEPGDGWTYRVGARPPAPTAGLGSAGPVSGLARDRHLMMPPEAFPRTRLSDSGEVFRSEEPSLGPVCIPLRGSAGVSPASRASSTFCSFSGSHGESGLARMELFVGRLRLSPGGPREKNATMSDATRWVRRSASFGLAGWFSLDSSGASAKAAPFPSPGSTESFLWSSP